MAKWKLSNRSKKNLEGLHPNLIMFINILLEVSNRDFAITHGVRNLAQQNELYKKGRTEPGIIVTDADGKLVRSNHQINIRTGLGHAFDIAIYKDGKITWEEEIYDEFVTDEVRGFMKDLNICWGGDWEGKEDRPHFEYKG